MNITNFMKGLMALACITCISSCQDEEFGYSLDDVRKGQYAREFETTFGKVDPNQDWTMATLVKANINLPQIQGVSKMNIMTGDPHLASTRLLAQVMLQDGVGAIDFDAIKGNDNVFVTVEQDNHYKLYDNYIINSGVLDICIQEEPVVTAISRAQTRATQSGTCATQLGDKVELTGISFNSDNYREAWVNYAKKQYEDWSNSLDNQVAPFPATVFTLESMFEIDWSKLNDSDLKPSDFVWRGGIVDVANWEKDSYCYFFNGGASALNWYLKERETKKIGEWQSATSQLISEIAQARDADNKKIKTIWKTLSLQKALVLKDEKDWEIISTKHPVLQYLIDVETTAASPWTCGEGYALFGDGFFEEQLYYWGKGGKDKDKTLAYGSTPQERIAVISKIEDGFKAKTTGGEISIPYIYGSTEKNNQFGYILYEDGQDPLLQPHYVLMENARPDNNIYKGSYGSEPFSGTNIYYQFIKALEQERGWLSESWYSIDRYVNFYNTPVYGTEYKLMCYDEKTKKMTYDIPSGLNLIFFILNVGNEQQLTAHTGYNVGNFNYSLPSLNKRIGHLYGNSGSPTYSSMSNEGSVKAATWKVGNNTYLGFEDGGNDEDLNDIVLLVDGNFTTNVLTLVPIKWHINLQGKHMTDDSDLFTQYNTLPGNSFVEPSTRPINGKKKFLGWSTTPDNSSNDCSLSITGTAPNNGMCYYAIWEDDVVPDPKPQSWLFACEDLGGSHDYDFNDVVWEVKKNWNNGVCTGTVEILAAGGTLPFTLYFKGQKICSKTEVFSDYTTETVINAGSGVSQTAKYVNDVTSTPYNVAGITKDWSAENDKSDFSLEVETTSGTIFIQAYAKGENGKTPQVLVVPSNWEWPTEGTNIKEAYPNFGAQMDWSNKVSGNVCQREIEESTEGSDNNNSQYGTLVSLDANNIVSKETLRSICSSGSISVTVTGCGTQWQTGNVYLKWDEKKPDWGPGQHQVNNIPNSAVSSNQYTTVDEATVLTTSITAEQYSRLLGDDILGGLIIEIYNITQAQVYIKAN